MGFIQSLYYTFIAIRPPLGSPASGGRVQVGFIQTPPQSPPQAGGMGAGGGETVWVFGIRGRCLPTAQTIPRPQGNHKGYPYTSPNRFRVLRIGSICRISTGFSRSGIGEPPCWCAHRAVPCDRPRSVAAPAQVREPFHSV